MTDIYGRIKAAKAIAAKALGQVDLDSKVLKTKAPIKCKKDSTEKTSKPATMESSIKKLSKKMKNEEAELMVNRVNFDVPGEKYDEFCVDFEENIENKYSVIIYDAEGFETGDMIHVTADIDLVGEEELRAELEAMSAQNLDIEVIQVDMDEKMENVKEKAAKETTKAKKAKAIAKAKKANAKETKLKK